MLLRLDGLHERRFALIYSADAMYMYFEKTGSNLMVTYFICAYM